MKKGIVVIMALLNTCGVLADQKVYFVSKSACEISLNDRAGNKIATITETPQIITINLGSNYIINAGKSLKKNQQSCEKVWDVTLRSKQRAPSYTGLSINTSDIKLIEVEAEGAKNRGFGTVTINQLNLEQAKAKYPNLTFE